MWRIATVWIRRYHKLLVLVLLGFLIRLLLSLMQGSGDIHNHIVWAQDFLGSGPAGFYERNFRLRLGVIEPNYPPLSIALFAVLTLLYNACSALIWTLNLAFPFFPSSLVGAIQSPQTISSIMRLPAILADVGIALVVYAYIRQLRGSNRAAIAGACGVLFNPAFFYNSAIWGQIESIPLLFVMLALYYLLFLKRELMATVFLFIALMTKQTAVVFLPIFVLVWIRYYRLYKTVRAGGILALLTFLIFLPFNSHGFYLFYPFVTYLTKILTASGLPYASNHAFNFWALATGFQNVIDSRLFVLGLTYRMVSIIITVPFVILCCYHLWIRKVRPIWVLYSSLLLTTGVFIFLTRMHERHLEMALPFLLIMAVLHTRYRWIYIYVSVFHVFNLYHDRWQPLLPGLKPFLSLYETRLIVTLIFLGLFIYLCYGYFVPGKKGIAPNDA